MFLNQYIIMISICEVECGETLHFTQLGVSTCFSTDHTRFIDDFTQKKRAIAFKLLVVMMIFWCSFVLIFEKEALYAFGVFSSL